MRSPGVVRSAISVSSSSSKICVPTGTFSTTSAPSRAGAVLAHAVAALLRLEMLLVAVVDQRVQVRHALDDHVAAFAAVAAVGPAELDELLAPEADAAVAAVARAHIDLGLIEELHGKGLAPALSNTLAGRLRAPGQLRSCRTRRAPPRGRAGRSRHRHLAPRATRSRGSPLACGSKPNLRCTRSEAGLSVKWPAVR